MPNGGNLGDNLIAAATIQRLDRSGLRWEFMRGGKETVSNEDVLIYGGGGSLVDLYRGGIDCVRFLQSLGRPVVVLPQTVRGHQDFWEACLPLTLFCRDQVSFDYASRYKQIEVLAADDMATHLDMDDPLFHPIVTYHKHMTARDEMAGRSLNAFRRDGESSASDLAAKGSVDLSELSFPRLKDKTDIYASAVLFLMSAAGHRLVRTDRLHVSVAASLVGAEVELFDNNYGKNGDVFRFTLRDRFPKIIYHGYNFRQTS